MDSRGISYAAIQYSSNPERFEALNVGVVIYDHTSNRLSSKITSDFSRVSKLFGKVNKTFLKLSLDDFVARVRSEVATGGHEALQKFKNSRSNNLCLTSFFPVNASSLEDAQQLLFPELVGEIHSVKRATRVSQKLKYGLKELSILKRFDQHPEPVTLPRYNHVIKPDLGIRNDYYQLIEAVRFDDPEQGFKETGSHALAGRALYASHMSSRLVVVGDFGEQPNSFFEAVREDLEAAHTKLYRLDNLKQFVDEIVPSRLH